MKKRILKLSAAIMPLSLVSLGFLGLSNNSAKPNDTKLINHDGEQTTPSQSTVLDTARRWKNSNFTSSPVEQINPGSLVLTGKKALTRIDLYGNVVWTFDPNNAEQLKQGEYDINGKADFSKNVSYDDLKTKTVVEAVQDQSNPNTFYLLLIPDAAIQQQQQAKDQTLENFRKSAQQVDGAEGAAVATASSSTTTFSSATLLDDSEEQTKEPTESKIPKELELASNDEQSDSINSGKSYSQIKGQKNLQGAIVKITENLSDVDSEHPFVIDNVAYISPEAMVKNYPTTWTQGKTKGTNVTEYYDKNGQSDAGVSGTDNDIFWPQYFPKRIETKPETNLADSSFTEYEHPEWYDGGQFVMPWMQYITNLGGLYAKNGTAYLFGGNGTWVNNQTALSMGVFRVNFGSQTEEPKVVGYPYAILLSGIALEFSPKGNGGINIGQDTGYHFVPRLAVGGVSSPRVANGNIFLGSAITWGTNGGNILDSKYHSPKILTNNNSGKKSGNYPGAWTNKYLANGVVTAPLQTHPAGGNTKEVESLFTTAFKLDALNTLPDDFNKTSNKGLFNYVMLDGKQWHLGTRKDSSWLYTDVIHNVSANTQQQLLGNSEYGNETAGARNLLNALTTAKGFDRRNIGNVVYTYDNRTNTESVQDTNLTYYYQVGGAIMSWPELRNGYRSTAQINIYNLTASDFGKTKNDNTQTRQSKLNAAYASSDGSQIYNGSIYVKQASFTASPKSYTWDSFLGLSTTSTGSVISNWTQSGYRIRISEGYSVNKMDFTSPIQAVVNMQSLDQYYVQLQGKGSLNAVEKEGLNSSNYKLDSETITNPLEARNNQIGNGRFLAANELPSSFLQNKISDIIQTDTDGSLILRPDFKSLIYAYKAPADNPNIEWRLLVTDYSKDTNDFIKLLPQVKLSNNYVPIPQGDSVFVAQRTYEGFDALASWVIPVAIAIPLVIVALALALGLGIGIPMAQNRKAMKQGFAMSNKKVDILTTAVGSVFKQIINRTSVSNIKKSPQMLQSGKKDAAKPAAAKPAAPGAKPTAAKPAAPGAKPAAPKPAGAKPAAPKPGAPKPAAPAK